MLADVGSAVVDLYGTLAEWWPLVSPAAEYEAEAARHWAALESHARRPVRSVLELGCGGGNNALFLKRRCEMVLTDLSPQMLRVSRRANPACEHLEGDMRSMRLGREFDAVFVHDAILYMLTLEDLASVMATARAHCAPGGVALFAPDYTLETWTGGTCHSAHESQGRALGYFEWAWDPDPDDTTTVLDLALLLREGDEVQVKHERHLQGLFPRATWLALVEGAGFEGAAVPPGAGCAESFVGVRPD